MKNGKCHLLKIARARYIVILKGLGTSFQSAALSQKNSYEYLSYSILVFDQAVCWQDFECKRNKHICNLHYIAMLNIFRKMLKSLILNVDLDSWNNCFLADVGYLIKLLSNH